MKKQPWFKYTLGVMLGGLFGMVSVGAYSFQQPMRPTIPGRYIDPQKQLQLEEQLNEFFHAIERENWAGPNNPAGTYDPRKLTFLKRRYNKLKEQVEAMGGVVSEEGNKVKVEWKQ